MRLFVCWASNTNKKKEKCGCALYSLTFWPVHFLPPSLFPFSHFHSNSSISDMLIHTATPGQVCDCGLGVATGEEGKYQRRSGRGGAEKVCRVVAKSVAGFTWKQ